MIWRRVIPNLFTVLALLAGVFSIVVILDARCERFEVAAHLIMLAMIFDGLDGNLARLFRTTSELGGEMDTFVDIIAFGLAPAILFYQVALPHHPVWRAFITGAIVLSGVFRLARFKVTNPDHGQKGYWGLPITANAGWIALFVFLSYHRLGAVSAGAGPSGLLFVVGVVVLISLQVSNVRYSKPTKNPALFVPCVLLVLLFSMRFPYVTVPAAVILLVIGFCYVVLGPLFGKRPDAAEAALPCAHE